MLLLKGPAIFPTPPPGPGAMDNVLAFGTDGTLTAARHREAAGRFHLGHAIALCAAGEVLRARGEY